MPHSAGIRRRRLLDRPSAALGLASIVSAALHVFLLAVLYGPRQPLRPAAYPAITVELAPSASHRVAAGQVEPKALPPTLGEHPLSPRPVILAPPAPAPGPGAPIAAPAARPTPGEHARPAGPMTASPRPGPRTSSVRPPENSAGGEPPEAPPPGYYPARDLDVYPALLAPVDAHGVGGRTGSVRLEVRIDDRGRVVHVAVLEADAAPAVAAQARHALAAARFSPALRDGRAVHSRLLVELTYGHGPRARPISDTGDSGSATPEPAQ